MTPSCSSDRSEECKALNGESALCADVVLSHLQLTVSFWSSRGPKQESLNRLKSGQKTCVCLSLSLCFLSLSTVSCPVKAQRTNTPQALCVWHDCGILYKRSAPATAGHCAFVRSDVSGWMVSNIIKRVGRRKTHTDVYCFRLCSDWHRVL